MHATTPHFGRSSLFNSDFGRLRKKRKKASFLEVIKFIPELLIKSMALKNHWCKMLVIISAVYRTPWKINCWFTYSHHPLFRKENDLNQTSMMNYVPVVNLQGCIYIYRYIHSHVYIVTLVQFPASQFVGAK